MVGDFYFKGFNVQVKLRTLGVVENYRGAKTAWSWTQRTINTCGWTEAGTLLREAEQEGLSQQN